MENILEVKGLNKSYQHFSLQDVSFSLPEGCITGFIGINGAGKTSTLKSILGLTPKISGDIRLFGLNMDTNEKEIKERIGIVLDDGGFYDELSLSEMKNIVASAYKSWDNKVFQSYLERFTLNPKQKIGTLSKGMRMKYALALALSHKAELLIMDEPTSGLDPLIRDDVLDMLIDFVQDENHSVLVSSHITSDLEKVADYITFLHKGKLIFTHEKDELVDNYGILSCGAAVFDTLDKSEIVAYRKEDYQFKVLVKDRNKAAKQYPNAIVGPATIEEIMLFYVKGEMQ